MSNELKKSILEQLAKSKSHLQYSFNKVQNISFAGDFDEEQLETLESFSSRFARFSDIVISKYFRLLIKEKDPAFRGSVIDALNLAEKYGWIDSAQTWRRIRELRNVAAHEYEAENYKKLYQELVNLTPTLLKVTFTNETE